MVDIHVIAASMSSATKSTLLPALQAQWPDARVRIVPAGLSNHPLPCPQSDLAIILHGPLSADTAADIAAIRATSVCPIAIVAPSVPESVHAEWLHAGADVVVGAMAETKFLAILEALLRRARLIAAHPARTRTVGDIEINAGRGYLLVGSERVHLTPTELHVLEALADDVGECVPAAHLMQALWGMENEALRRSLKVHVSRLRHKLEKAGSTWTVTGIRDHGYVLEKLGG